MDRKDRYPGRFINFSQSIDNKTYQNNSEGIQDLSENFENKIRLDDDLNDQTVVESIKEL